MRFGIDFLEQISPAEARDLGASFVTTYVPTLSARQAQEYAAADLDIVVVFESDGHSFEGGFGAGEEEAHRALLGAMDAGMVGGYPIIFAPADTDLLNPAFGIAAADEYLRGVASVLPLSRIWGYQGYPVVKHWFDSGLISGAFQTSAWSSEGHPLEWDPRAALRQVEYTTHGWDGDQAVMDFFGQWRPGVPFSKKPPTPTLAFLTPVEREAYNEYVKLMKHPHLNAKKINAVKAELAVARGAIYVAAVDGKLAGGKKTQKGWHVNNRLERYHFIEKIVPPKPD